MAALANLSRGVKIFLAVDVVLVLGLVVAAIVVLGGGSDGGGTTADPSAPAAQAASGAATDGATSGATSDVATSFASPTGNIACTMSPDGVTCTIANISTRCPRPRAAPARPGTP